jgi:hypothetical protein
VDGIQGNMGIAILEENVDDDQIMYVVKVFTQTLGRDAWVDTTEDNITSCTVVDIVGDVSWQNELTLIPLDHNLGGVSGCAL